MPSLRRCQFPAPALPFVQSPSPPPPILTAWQAMKSRALCPASLPCSAFLPAPAAVPTYTKCYAGLIFFRHSPNTMAFLGAWQAKLESDESVWDQNAFNWLIHEGLVPLKSHSSNDRLVRLTGSSSP